MLDASAQNVRAIQTCTNPQSRQVNNSPVIVIPKKESNSATQSAPKESPNHTVRKVENMSAHQGSKRQVNKRGK